MALDFANILKAQITQTVLATLLERGGYRVTRLGIEELFAEIKYIDLPQYMGLNLPMGLRYLPDLLVADLDITTAYLVEVKFRRTFDDLSSMGLYQGLSEQRKYWPNAYAVVMIAESFVPNGRFHQDYIRVIPPDQAYLNILIRIDLKFEERWASLPHLQHVFRKFFKSEVHQDFADLVTPALQNLSSL